MVRCRQHFAWHWQGMERESALRGLCAPHSGLAIAPIRTLKFTLVLAVGVALAAVAPGCTSRNQGSSRGPANHSESGSTDCFPAGWSAIGGQSALWQCFGSTITAHIAAGDSILASSQVYGDVALSATVATTNREASLAVRLQDAGNGYIIIFLPDGIGWRQGRGGIWIAKRTAGVEEYLAYWHGPDFPSLGQSAELSVAAVGSTLKVSLNGREVLKRNDLTYASGRVGLRVYGDAVQPCDATFSNLAVK